MCGSQGEPSWCPATTCALLVRSPHSLSVCRKKGLHTVYCFIEFSEPS